MEQVISSSSIVGASASVPQAPVAVRLTEKAAEMAKQAMADEGLANAALRVGVIGGGCSGLQYLLDFAEESGELDFVSQEHGVRVFCDAFSAAHLRGTVVDYADGLQGSGFKFENPNMVRSCGCGQSFQ